MIAACFIYILRQNARSPLFRVQLDGQRFIHLRAVDNFFVPNPAPMQQIDLKFIVVIHHACVRLRRHINAPCPV